MSKKFKLENIWDSRHAKLVVMVVSGQNLYPKAGNTCDPSVKITYGKQTFKTKVVKKSTSPVWEECFFIEPDDESELKIDVYHNSTFSSKFIGTYNVGRPAVVLEQDEVINKDCLLQGTKKKSKVTGSIQLRLYYTTLPETRPPGASNHLYNFYYEQYFPQFKTGDLILYGGTGIIATLTKLYSNSPFSHLGVVLRFPNKWTDKEELYILEVTRNIDNFLDVIADVPRNGINIFRLQERLHQFHGNSIWWAPLKRPVAPEAKDRMLDWLFDEHAKPDPFPRSPPNSKVARYLLDKLELGNGARHKWYITELFANELIVQLFRKMDISVWDGPSAEGSPSPLAWDVVKCGHFADPPVLLRSARSTTEIEERAITATQKRNNMLLERYKLHGAGGTPGTVRRENSADLSAVPTSPNGMQPPPLMVYPIGVVPGDPIGPPPPFAPGSGIVMVPPGGAPPPGFVPVAISTHPLSNPANVPGMSGVPGISPVPGMAPYPEGPVQDAAGKDVPSTYQEPATPATAPSREELLQQLSAFQEPTGGSPAPLLGLPTVSGRVLERLAAFATAAGTSPGDDTGKPQAGNGAEGTPTVNAGMPTIGGAPTLHLPQLVQGESVVVETFTVGEAAEGAVEEEEESSEESENEGSEGRRDANGTVGVLPTPLRIEELRMDDVDEIPTVVLSKPSAPSEHEVFAQQG